MSEATRLRMAQGQQRRRAGLKKLDGLQSKKRKMSAEGRKAIAEATRKRWEAYRAEKAAAG